MASTAAQRVDTYIAQAAEVRKREAERKAKREAVEMETCSWCVEEVPDSSLREAPDGARICRECRTEAKAAR